MSPPQIFSHHYHPEFVAGCAKKHHSKVPTSHHSGISQEEREDWRRYGGLASHQQEKFRGTFPGNYAWLCRLESLKNAVGDFFPGEMKFLNLYQSCQMPELVSGALDGGPKVHAVPHAAKKVWFEYPQMPVAGMGQLPNSFSVPFVTSVRNCGADSQSYRTNFQDTHKKGHTKQKYESHCFLPAASEEDLRLVHVDFVSGFLIAFYGPSGTVKDQMWTVGMAVYCVDSRSYYYIR